MPARTIVTVISLSLATLAFGCETNKPKGGVVGSSASSVATSEQPSDEGGGKSAAAEAGGGGSAPSEAKPAETGDSNCAAVVEHYIEMLFDRARRELPPEQLAAAEDNKPQIKLQLNQACEEMWSPEFRACLLAAAGDEDVNQCAQKFPPRPRQPPQPPANQPGPAKAETGPSCKQVAANVMRVAEKSPEMTAEKRKQLPQWRTAIEQECEKNQMPPDVRICLLRAKTEADLKNCGPMLLGTPK